MTETSRWPLSGTESPSARAELIRALAGLGLNHPAPVLVLVGGAANLTPEVEAPLRLAFDALVPEIDRLGAALVDGGTAFGVMRMIGDARRRLGGGFPLIGVAAAGTVDRGSLPAGARVQAIDMEIASEPGTDGAQLDPDHSHFLLVPGDRWGDESSWIDAAAAVLAGDRPRLTLVAAGGQITALDVTVALQASRALLVLAGTGGTADLIADAWSEGRAIPEIPDLPFGPRERALVSVVELAEAGTHLPALVRRILSG